MIQFLYKTHKYFGIVLFFPICLWCISGLLHPAMSHLARPELASKHYPQQNLNTLQNSAKHLSLQTVLTQAGIDKIQQARIVNIGETLYYQIHLKDKTPSYSASESIGPNPWVSARYFHINSGEELNNGDLIYAEQLARYFLGDQHSELSTTERVTQYSSEYGEVNRYLPVHKISFQRDDGMDIYVSTLSSRFANANHNSRKILLNLFATFHTWDFLGDQFSLSRTIPVAVFIALAFFSGLSGLVLYGVLYKRLQKLRNNSPMNDRAHKWHRTVGIFISLSLVGFATSGLHTVSEKFSQDPWFGKFANTEIETRNLAIDPWQEIHSSSVPIHNFSLASMNKEHYIQYHIIQAKEQENSPPFLYQNMETSSWLEYGDAQYAIYLAHQFHNSEKTGLDNPIHQTETQLISEFGMGYPGILRRLPVQKVVIHGGQKTTYFIETKTGKLAGRSTPQQTLRSLHFSFLHKYHMLDFMGKVNRDIVLSIIVLLIFTVSAVGGYLFLKPVLAKRKHSPVLSAGSPVDLEEPKQTLAS